jgi:hypothetical protein
MGIAGFFSWVYSENWEQGTEQKDLKKLQFGQKNQHNVGAKEGLVSEEITTTKKLPRTLHWDNRIIALSSY